MNVQLTEVDRRDLARHAWEAVKRLPAPRKVRQLMAAKLILELTPRLVAQREKELNDKWSASSTQPQQQPDPMPRTPTGLWLPDSPS